MLKLLRNLRIVPKRAYTVGTGLAAGAFIGAAYCNKERLAYTFKELGLASLETGWLGEPLIKVAQCDAKLNPQNSVVSETKSHALYLTIHLKPEASTSEVLKALANIEKFVDCISPRDIRDEDNEIIAGVGYGPSFLKRIYKDCTNKGIENFAYEHRKGGAANMPATGGDIFIHAKCHERGKLFELAQAIMKAIPSASVDKYEDIYGWVYRYGRDLSGFIDGTENPAEQEQRERHAINPQTGGSYVITQKWLHKHSVIANTPDGEMEKWIGRKRADSVALNPRAASSHVARTTGNLDGKSKKYHIVRQSQPFGTASKDSGLFFIAYAKSTEPLNWMLDQMAGAGDGLYDHVFHLSDCVSGNYFYFPSLDELNSIYQSHGAGAGKAKLW